MIIVLDDRDVEKILLTTVKKKKIEFLSDFFQQNSHIATYLSEFSTSPLFKYVKLCFIKKHCLFYKKKNF